MESTKNIYQRVLAIMSELNYIQKGSQKVNGMYRFVSHDQVTAAIHPLLVQHGVVVVPTVVEHTIEGQRSTVKIKVEFVNVDEPIDRFEIVSYGQGIDSGDKGIGKAYSYAYKYALLKTFALETGDDPDNDAKTVHRPEVKTKLEDKAPVEDKKKSLEELKKFVSKNCESMTDQEKDLAQSYMIKYADYYKKTLSQSMTDYADSEKFMKDFLKWKKKTEKDSIAEAA